MGRSRSGGALDEPLPAIDVTARPVRASSDRRAIACLVLSCALAVALGMPTVLNTGVSGTATPLPLPAPPPIGSCVLLAGDGFDLLVGVVPCDQPHDGEITMNWPAGQLPKASPRAEPNEYGYRAGGGMSRFVYFQCHGWNTEYVGSPEKTGALWVPAAPLYTGDIIYAPPSERAGSRFWSACVVRPLWELGGYRGTVGGSGADSRQTRPGQYISCLASSPSGTAELVYGSCAVPHRVEPMAVDYGVHEAVPESLALTECEEEVRQLTGATDPTYGGQLRIAVEDVRLRTLSVVEAAADNAGEDPGGDCLVELVGAGSLVGSLVGWGDRPLPLA